MGPSWKNTGSLRRQLRNIGRLCRLILVSLMLISTLGVRFSKRATCRKQRRVILRRAGSNQSSPNLITTWERFSCAKATFHRRSGNLKKRYVFIPTFRKPRKICASPGQATLRFFRNRPSKIFALSALRVACVVRRRHAQCLEYSSVRSAIFIASLSNYGRSSAGAAC